MQDLFIRVLVGHVTSAHGLMAELLQHRLLGLFSMSRLVLWPSMPHPIDNSMKQMLLHPLPSSWLSLVSKPAASMQTTVTEMPIR